MIESFQDRFRYLRLRSQIGVVNFGFDRYLNQAFYTSSEWRRIRNHVIARDHGRDLGMEGHEILARGAVHHMNPMQVEELVAGDERVLDPEFLITVSVRTHNAIHFGDERLLTPPMVVRRPGDTKLWLGAKMGRSQKYGKIDTELGEIPADEPVFMIRARDMTAPYVIRYYLSESLRAGADREHVDLVLDALEEIEDWQDKNSIKVKVPDSHRRGGMADV